MVCGSHELGDQVLAADLDGVHADLGREHVHRPLGRGRCLRPAGAAVGGDRRGVGDDAGRAALDVGDVVHRRRHRPGHERGQDRAHLGEPAAVLDDVQPVVRDLAVAVAADGDVLDLGAAVAERPSCSRCGSRASAAGGRRAWRVDAEQGLLGVARDLGAEAAADVGRDHPDAARRSSPLPAMIVSRGALRALRAQPLVQPGARLGWHPRDGRAADLERARRDALVDEAAR